MMRRAPCDEDLDELEGEPAPRRGTLERSHSTVADLLGRLPSGGDLVLVQHTAQQEAELHLARERVEALESQRRWLAGGVGVSIVVLLYLAMRKPKAPKGQIQARVAA
jgi:hypothetical protein